MILLLFVAALIFIATADWNRLKPTLNERVSSALGRPFAINGELTVEWRRDADAAGWRWLVPWMHVGAADLRIGNPDWATSPEFAVFERVDLRLALLPLLRREVHIPRIDVRQPALSLERLADGRTTWVFDQDDEPEAMRWKLDIGEIAFDRGRLAVADAIGRIQMEATIEPLGASIPFSDIMGKGGEAQTEGVSGSTESAPLEYVFGWKAKGRYRDEAFTGSGTIGGLLALHDPSRPFPLQADLKVGRTRIAVAGTLTDLRNLAALDLKLRLSGTNLADLYPLTGLTLPDTSAYSTDGRLSAELRKPEGAVYHYRDFKGRIGDSDVRGNLSYTDAEPRPLLKGEISSRLLHFADLAPLIGADYGAPRAGGPGQPPDRVLPVGPFRTERWRDMDADVRLSGKKLDRGEELPFTDMQAQLLLTNGELRLDPLRVGVAGGSLEGMVHLDGRKAQMRGHARLKARQLGLKKLFPGFEPMQTSLGEANGEVDLRGTGNSIAALLGSADGE
ncbi:MAG: AsmA family protein, partial [Azoarcus sp.]|nr:AsmA family protein [Azoarcus sp.]